MAYLPSRQVGPGYMEMPTLGGSTLPGGGSGFDSADLLSSTNPYTAAANLAMKFFAARRQGQRQDALIRNQLDQTRLNFADFNLRAPSQRGRNSVQGDILSNVQDVEILDPIVNTRGQPPRFSGGLRPSLLSNESRSLGLQMARQALLDQMAGPLQPNAKNKRF